jgi:RimJ/RimL family protein N-acetyltransferase
LPPVIRVSPDELSRAAAALMPRQVGPVFLLANLLRHGLGSDHPRAVNLWRNAEWSAFLGISNTGVCFPQMRDASAYDWAGLATGLRGTRLKGFNGAREQVGTAVEALSLQGRATSLDRIEPCLTLDLIDLIQPEGSGLGLRAPEEKDMDLLLQWRAAYRVETLGDSPGEAEASARAELPLWLADDAFRLAVRDGQPVSLTGFNARLPGLVQVGGVYTPPPLRRQGLARRALALHLREAAGAGVSRAVLFAASDHAARVYRAIGFQLAGEMRIVIYTEPAEVGP